MSITRRRRLSRQESQQQTRERLLEAAGEEIARKGATASVRDIAEAAGYSQGALYANYRSKELLFLDLLRSHMARELEELEKLITTVEARPDTAMAGVEAWLRQLNSDRDWSMLSTELQMHARREKTFGATYEKLVAEHRAALGVFVERLFRSVGCVPPAPPEDIAGALMALAHGMALQRRSTRQGDPDPSGPMIKLILDGLIGLAAPLKGS
jgi:AcrR family transcriptional regulator